MILLFVFFVVTSLFLHLFFFYYAIHVVINGQVLELGGVLALVEHQLELVVLCVWAAVLLACWYRRWRKQWINSKPMKNKINSKVNERNMTVTYLSAFSTMAGISLARYGLESSKQGLVLTSISQVLRSSSIMKS